jgi:hypothetical protein
MKTKEKMYAMIPASYGKNMLVPMHLLEQIVAECYLVGTTYADGRDNINEVEAIRKFEVFSQSDVDVAIAQQELQG